MSTMPAVFLGHGSPMNTLEDNVYTRAWRDFAASIPTPSAILAISAHWYLNGTAVTAMDQPRTIHDFYGFPDELFAYEYPAPGSPDLAARIPSLVAPTWVGLDFETWGLDHGTWSVLAHMYPRADVPVVQLSIDANKAPEEHVMLGAALEELRHDGVLIVASGNVVHNLRAMTWGDSVPPADWNVAFDQAATALMTTRPGAITELTRRPEYKMAAPTPDHLIPLYYLGGVAAAAGARAEVLVEGYFGGSLSMTSYVVGAS